MVTRTDESTHNGTDRVLGLALVVAVLVALGGLLAAMLVGGDAPTAGTSGLPESPVSVQWGLLIARVISDLLAVMTAGLLLAAAALLPSKRDMFGQSAGRAALWASWSAWCWALVSLVILLLDYSDTLGTGLRIDTVQLWSFVTQSQQGAAWLVMASLAAFAGVVAREAKQPLGAWVALVLALGAVLCPAVTGHAASAGDHDLATSSLVVHVVAVVLWVGGLVSLVWYQKTDGRFLSLAARRFSAFALWAFIAVGISGAVNAWVRLGSVEALLTTRYGAVVAMKIIAFVLLGVFGYAHRSTSLRRLESGERSAFTRLAIVEAAVMVATLGIAVGLSFTAPPGAEHLALPTPAEVLLGVPMPAAPSVANLLWPWRLDLIAATFIVVAAIGYARGMWTLRRRGDRWSVGHAIAWYAGLAVLAFGTMSGLAVYGRTAFSMHMGQHMVLSMMAPLLLVLGAPITLALRALPASPADKPSGPREWLLAGLRSPVGRVLTHPLTAFALFISAPYIIYFSGLFELSLRQHWAHELLHVHFVLVGYLFYQSLIGIDPIPYRAPYPMRLGTLFATLAFHAFFAVALMSSTSVIAEDYFLTLQRPWWTDLLADQTGGAALAWAFGELPGIVVLIVLLYQWSRDDDRQAQRADRQADRDNDAELVAYNRMLAARRDSANDPR